MVGRYPGDLRTSQAISPDSDQTRCTEAPDLLSHGSARNHGPLTAIGDPAGKTVLGHVLVDAVPDRRASARAGDDAMSRLLGTLHDDVALVASLVELVNDVHDFQRLAVPASYALAGFPVATARGEGSQIVPIEIEKPKAVRHRNLVIQEEAGCPFA
jgi:hypothetical protein